MGRTGWMEKRSYPASVPPYPAHPALAFADRALAQRLERAEGEANARFVEARARAFPDSGASWIDVAGAYALFDGVGSPCTQTFGFGLFAAATAADLDIIERFFAERSSPVFHEVSPLADPRHIALLSERGYHPIELSTILYRVIGDRVIGDVNPAITVRQVRDDEHEVWAQTAAAGWSETAGLEGLFKDIGRINALRPDTRLFVAEEDGRPIAAGALSLAGATAILAGASTVPAARHRGAQLGLLATRLSVAAAEGCDLATMSAQPGSGSQRNAERHGFRVAYTRTKWERQLGSSAAR
jgi:hypothetical protein